MFLYELAIELGKHSNELAQAAADAGMVGVGPATMLDAAQVATLRAQFAPPAAAAPPSWGPPPGASLPPPSPLRPEGSLARPAMVPGATAVTGPPIDGPKESGWSGGQVAAVAAVVIAVVGLFAFMGFNSSPTAEQTETAVQARAALASSNDSTIPEATTTTTTAPPAAPAPVAAPAPTAAPAPPPQAPPDLCASLQRWTELFEQLGESTTLGAMKATVSRIEDEFMASLDQIEAALGAGNASFVQVLRDWYGPLFEAIPSARSQEDIMAGVAGQSYEATEDATRTLVQLWVDCR